MERPIILNVTPSLFTSGNRDDQKALEISEEYKYTTTIIRTLINMSAIQTMIYDNTSVIESLYRAIGFAEKSGNQTERYISKIYYNVSIIYFTILGWMKTLAFQKGEDF